MTNNLFLSELMFITVAMIASLVFRRLYISKNGTLRKIMITYFLIEVFIYASSAVYFWMLEKDKAVVTVDVFRLIILTPKALVMLWLLSWLSKQTK